MNHKKYFTYVGSLNPETLYETPYVTIITSFSRWKNLKLKEAKQILSLHNNKS